MSYTPRTDYERFLDHLRRAERAIGRHVVNVILAGGDLRQVVYPNGVVKGLDRDVTSVILLSKVAHKRAMEATRAWVALRPVGADEASEIAEMIDAPALSWDVR